MTAQRLNVRLTANSNSRSDRCRAAQGTIGRQHRPAWSDSSTCSAVRHCTESMDEPAVAAFSSSEVSSMASSGQLPCLTLHSTWISRCKLLISLRIPAFVHHLQGRWLLAGHC